MPIIFMTHRSFTAILSSHNIENLSLLRVICIGHNQRNDVIGIGCFSVCLSTDTSATTFVYQFNNGTKCMSLLCDTVYCKYIIENSDICQILRETDSNVLPIKLDWIFFSTLMLAVDCGFTSHSAIFQLYWQAASYRRGPIIATRCILM